MVSRTASSAGRSGGEEERMVSTPRGPAKLACTALLVVFALAACGGGRSGSGPDVVVPDAGGGTTGGDAAADAPEVWTVPLFDLSGVSFPYCPIDEAEIERIHDGLSLRARIGQHVMPGVDGASGQLTPGTRTKLEEYLVGGVFTGVGAGITPGDPATTARFVHAVKAAGFAATGVPLFVALDQEGGPNANINSITGGTDTIGSMPIGATRDPRVAFEEFSIMGREVQALGFNMDFGPVLDTLLVTRHGNLNTRPFGPDPALNAQLGIAAMAGLQANLVLPTAKHFPGDGLESGNTHTVHVTVTADRETLDRTILAPFRAAFDAGCDGVMTIPAAYTALDPERSAITSRAVTTTLLREEWGFEGLVVTDSLGMAGARIGLADEEIPGVAALQAGADVLLHVTIGLDELGALYAGIEQGLADGSIPEEEFSSSTRRILRMKQRYCLFEAPAAPDPEDTDTLFGALARPEDAAVVRGHAERAVVLLEDDGSALPLAGQRVLYVGPGTVFRDPGSGWLNMVDQTFGDAMRARDDGVAQLEYLLPFEPSNVLGQVQARLDEVDVLVVGTLQGRFSLAQQQLLEWILEEVERPVVHVLLGVPFDYFQSRGRVAAAVALMGSRGPMVEAGAALLYGAIEPRGTMLFDLASETTDVEPGTPGSGGEDTDRCAAQGIDCSDRGICVDTGADVGCVCHPNWHPSRDGRDCIPDGQDG